MKRFKTITLSVVAAAAAAFSSAQAGVIFQDSFERQTPGNWRIYQTAGDHNSWINTGGAGIEIQNASIGNRTAADGNFYVELDSHTNKRGGLAGESSNSMMASMVDLVQGQLYEVSFAYRPRTNSDGDNGIQLSVGTLSGNSFADETVLATVSETSSSQPGWEIVTVVFRALADHNAISFAAFGTANSLGGYIDAVSVSAVPLPAGMVLFGVGLAAMGATRRKAKVEA